MISLKFNSRKLTHSSFESSIYRIKAYSKKQRWSSKVKKKGIFVDLSQVEWCDLSTIVRLVLFIEKALKDKIRVEIALPLPCASFREREFIDEYESQLLAEPLEKLRRRIDRRSRALDFLKYINFPQQVKCSHLQDLEDNQIRIIEDYDDSEEEYLNEDESNQVGYYDPQENLDDAFPVHDQTYEHIFPLRWFSSLDLNTVRADLEKLRRFLESIISQREKGILRLDVEEIANVIFYELIQNTIVHSGTSHCLLAAWCQKPEQPIYLDNYYQQEYPFFSEWIEPNKFPLVDIAFGDSGRGIINVLGQEFEQEIGLKEGVPEGVEDPELQTLFWSLGRWSTSQKDLLRRGTRGLYRVHRLVKAYSGMFTLRSNNSWVGWDHGGYDRQEALHKSDIAYSPGTFCSIRLTDLTRFNLPILCPPIKSRDIDFVIVDPLEINAEGLTQEFKAKLRNKLTKSPTLKHRSVITWLEVSKDQNIEQRKCEIETSLDQLSKLVNPGSLVVLAPEISPKELETYIDSVNQEKSKANYDIAAKPEAHDVVDVFSVVDRNFKTHWLGGLKVELDLLASLHDSPDARIEVDEIEKYLPDEQERKYVLTDLKQQNDLIKFDKSGAISLRFNTKNALVFIENAVCTRLEDILKASYPVEIGVLNDGPYFSPSLTYVKKWLEMDKLLKSFGWFELNEEKCSEFPELGLPSYISEYLNEQIGSIFQTTKSLTDFLKVKLSNDDNLEKNQHLIATSILKKGQARYLFYTLVSKFFNDFNLQPDYLVSDSHVNKNHIETINMFLGTHNMPIILPRILLPTLPGELRNILEDLEKKKVLIYVDLVLSGNAARQLVEQCLRKGADPVAVVCIYDLRKSTGQAFIQCLGYRIPIISLAQEQDFILDENGIEIAAHEYKVQLINSSTEKPQRSDERPIKLEYLISSEKINDYIQKTGALYFNHIKRLSRSGSLYDQYHHFSFYLDANKLLADDEFFKDTQKALKEQIKQFCKYLNKLDFKAKVKDFLILYFNNGEVKADRTSILFRGVGSAHSPLAIHLGPLNWGLRDAEAEIVNGQNIVVVDWNALSGTTITRLIYSVAEKGAKSVLAVVLFSRIPEEQEKVLRSLSQIKVPIESNSYTSLYPNIFRGESERDYESSGEIREVPIRVCFISRVKIPTYGEANCPICRQNERVSAEFGELQRYPTKFMREFATKQMRSFRPKELEDIRKGINANNDYDPGLSPHQTVIMLKLRQDLEKALQETVYRKKIQDFLLDLQSRLEQGNDLALDQTISLVCLLAIELQWVKLPPLDFQEMRNILIKITLEFLRISDNEKILQHAAIVLSTTGKRDFARELPNLVNRFSQKPYLLQQLLYDTFTLLDGRYHQHPSVLEPIVNSLRVCRDTIKNISQNGSDELVQIYSSAQALYAIAVRKLAFASSDNVNETNVLQAWLKLREILDVQFSDPHRELPSAIKNLYYGSMEKIWEEVHRPIAETSYWESARQDWMRCTLLLEDQIFSNVRKAWTVFEGKHADGYFGELDREFLREVCFDDNSPKLRHFNDLLGRFCNKPPDSTSNDWNDFKRIRYSLGNVLLNFPVSHDDGALLYKFVQGCPADIAKVTKDYSTMEKWRNLAEISCVILSGNIELMVFCHKTLLDEIFNELFNNAAVVHKKPDAPDKISIKIIISLDTDKGEVVLNFLNNGSDPNYHNPRLGAGGKHGLKRLEKALEPYKGKIIHKARTLNELDYLTQVTLKYGG